MTTHRRDQRRVSIACAPRAARKSRHIASWGWVMLVVLVVGTLVALGMVLGWLVIEELLTQRGKRLPPPDPIGVLDHRFATGEIDEADWSRRRAALTYGPPLPLD